MTLRRAEPARQPRQGATASAISCEGETDRAGDVLARSTRGLLARISVVRYATRLHVEGGQRALSCSSGGGFTRPRYVRIDRGRTSLEFMRRVCGGARDCR